MPSGKIGALLTLLPFCLFSLGVGYAVQDGHLALPGPLAGGRPHIEFGKIRSNDPPGSVDPGYNRDVATTEAKGGYAQGLAVSLINAYPGYTSEVEFTVRNAGSMPMKIQSIDADSPSEIDVKLTSLEIGQVIESGGRKEGRLTIHVKEGIAENGQYGFHIDITAAQWNTQ